MVARLSSSHPEMKDYSPSYVVMLPQSVTLLLFVPQRRNFTLAFQAAESVGIKCTLVGWALPSHSGYAS